jgi:hypothetical protein
MNFNYKYKPNLVEYDLIKYYINKKKIKSYKTNNKESYINYSDYYNNYYGNSLFNFIRDNYGFFLISSLIIILLYVRYMEVNKRKNKLNEFINNN